MFTPLGQLPNLPEQKNMESVSLPFDERNDPIGVRSL